MVCTEMQEDSFQLQNNNEMGQRCMRRCNCTIKSLKPAAKNLIALILQDCKNGDIASDILYISNTNVTNGPALYENATPL